MYCHFITFISGLVLLITKYWQQQGSLIIEIYRMHLKISLIFLVLLPLLASGLQFKSSIMPSRSRCFYQILTANQKYRFDIYPRGAQGATYDINIEFVIPHQNQWQSFYSRRDNKQSQALNIHKLASITSTYRFCITNNNPQNQMQYQLTLQTGIELMELHLLPDKSDAENMILEMEWIQRQTNRVREMINRASGNRDQIQNLSSLTSTKIVIAVLVFTVSVLVLNGIFYKKMKKALHQRKII